MKNTIQKGILGVLAPSAGYAVSVSNVEAWLRVGSLAVGIIVGVLSAVSISLTIRRKLRQRREEELSR
jgi:hypothetical protein